MRIWSVAFSRYYTITHYNVDKFFEKDFASNYKFMFSAVERMLKKSIDDNEILKFIEDAIKIHMEVYC